MLVFSKIGNLPYTGILMYKPMIFSWILMTKLWGWLIWGEYATQPYFKSQSEHSMDHYYVWEHVWQDHIQTNAAAAAYQLNQLL